MNKKKVIVYIDGYNLYYGMREAFGGKYKWLDLQAFAESFLKPGMELVKVKYFTAITQSTSSSHTRQKIYLKALENHCDKLEVFKGLFSAQDKKCRNCGNVYKQYEEKKTDVNIACEILNDAHLNLYDCCYLVSGDSDLVPPLKIVKKEHLNKYTIVANPPKRQSTELCDVANAWFFIGKNKLRDSQLPEEVGGKFTRPEKWK